MSDETRRCRVITNQQDQPLELHLETGVVVLPPRGSATLDAAVAAGRQLDVLWRQRVVDVYEIDVAASPEEAAVAAPGPKRKSTTKAEE